MPRGLGSRKGLPALCFAGQKPQDRRHSRSRLGLLGCREDLHPGCLHGTEVSWAGEPKRAGGRLWEQQW
jgi:hypothetical protein